MKKNICLLFAVCLVLLTGCSSRKVEAQTWAYDTLCTATVWGGTDSAAVFTSAATEGQALLTPDGAKQYTSSQDGETIAISLDLFKILNQAGILYDLTAGAYDFTVAPLSDLWNVNAAVAPPKAESITERLALVEFDALTFTESSLTFRKAGMGIDIGSVGKGYGADYTVAALKNAGAEAGVISFGGNVTLFGTKDGEPFRIGIRDPRGNASDYLGVLTVTDTSVVTSGAYERYFEYAETVYHHLLDANTGYPRESDLLSVTVICSDGAQADMMSTALWLMGMEDGWKLYETLGKTEGFLPAEVIFVSQDGTVRVSDGIAPHFALTSDDYTLWKD
ncbi:MAG: FAD:protein FMN transferase [Clostridia bacterium]|nr:FAD:protein FMN transferase [Clostridia bacterium]